MPRGLGKSQRLIKAILQNAPALGLGPLTFATIRQTVVAGLGGHEDDRLNPTFERSLKRSLKALVDRGDVVFTGKGGQSDPYHYTTVEACASATGEKVWDTAYAKQIITELQAAVQGVDLVNSDSPGVRLRQKGRLASK